MWGTGGRPPEEQGFTLLELMLVLVLLSLLATTASFVLRDGNRSASEAQRIVAYLQQCRDLAVFSGYRHSVKLSDHQLVVSRLDAGEWLVSDEKPLLLPDTVGIELVDERETKGRQKSATVIFYSDGTASDINIRVYDLRDIEHEEWVKGDFSGRIFIAQTETGPS